MSSSSRPSESRRAGAGSRESMAPPPPRTRSSATTRERTEVPISGSTTSRRTASTSRTSNNDVVRDKRTDKIHITSTSTTTTRRVREPMEERERRPSTYKPPSRGSAVAPASPMAAPAAQWSPEATLIPTTTAPLATRVSFPPLSVTLPTSKKPQPLDQMTLEGQEACILDDLLFCLMGFEGQYLRFKETYNPETQSERLAGPQFKLPYGLDPSLKDLTSTLLKMATHYSAVEAFVEVQSREEFGTVNHALCAAIRKLLKDYLTLIAQLENQYLTNPAFTLHLFHLNTVAISHTLAQLYALAQEILRRNSMLEEDLDDSLDDSDEMEDFLDHIREGGDIMGSVGKTKMCKGGSVIALLTQRLSAMSGDPAARKLLTMLLREATRPYMRMLNEWLHRGSIKDPHAEFLIKEQKSIKRERLDEDYTDEYWEKRYTIREGEVPPQLEGVKIKVLLAGKYLNVVRECGGVDVAKEMKDVPLTFDDNRFLENVNSAYAHANESLLQLLLVTHKLPARLKSLKHYFFLDHSDYYSHFVDLASAELKKPSKEINLGRLQSLLDLALRQPGSVSANDPFKEDIKVDLSDDSLMKWLMRVVNVTGITEEGMEPIEDHQSKIGTEEGDRQQNGFSALQLNYVVPFPLSLVISRKTVLRYQLIFRYLVSLRHLESKLAGAWQDHNQNPAWKHRSKFPQVEIWKRRVWTLRARMLVFIQQLLYFCTNEVIEPNWNTMQSKLGKVTTVDELMQDHVDYLDSCLKECMLTNSKLLKIHTKIMQTCSFFAQYQGTFGRGLLSVEPNTEATYDPTVLQKLSEHLSKYEINFGKHLKILLDALNYYAATETVVLLGLCARLSTAVNEEDSRELNILVA